MCIILSIVHVFLYGWCFHLRSTCILFIYFYLFAWIMYCNCCVSLWLILFEGCLTVHLPHEIKWNANLMQQCNLLKFLSSTCFGRIRPSSEALDVNLSQYLTNWMHKNLFHNKFYFMPVHVSSTCVHHQEVKIVLHSLWYHHTYRCGDTRGCVMQFWPPDDKHMCSKHVEAWNKTYCETNFVHPVG